MTANIGVIDRLLRFIIGFSLIVAPFLLEAPVFEDNLYKYGAVVIGVILVGTASIKFCPLYRIFGLRTCKI